MTVEAGFTPALIEPGLSRPHGRHGGGATDADGRDAEAAGSQRDRTAAEVLRLEARVQRGQSARGPRRTDVRGRSRRSTTADARNAAGSGVPSRDARRRSNRGDVEVRPGRAAGDEPSRSHGQADLPQSPRLTDSLGCIAVAGRLEPAKPTQEQHREQCQHVVSRDVEGQGQGCKGAGQGGVGLKATIGLRPGTW